MTRLGSEFLKAFLSPIIIATLILCAIGTLFAFGSSQS